MTGLDIAAEIAALQAAPLPELHRAWQRHHLGVTLPSGLPRDLLVRAIAWQLQERAQGGCRRRWFASSRSSASS